MDVQSLVADPNPLASHYSHFRVGERLLLTGHSHQAWPDCAQQGLLAAWQDAAELVDAKWERAFQRAERVRDGFSRLLDDDDDGAIALGTSTHELLTRLLSALPLKARPRIVTTDQEFHSARRQLQRLGEEGIDVCWIAADPAVSVGERLAEQIDDRTACVLVSSVFFSSGQIAGSLDAAMACCERVGAVLVLDAYHHLNAVPFSLSALGLQRAYVVGGGYKYCQLGEGNCFLRLPAECKLRPVYTGWFAEFGDLEVSGQQNVAYCTGSARFAGSTYDPVSHYRATEVLSFFDEKRLTPQLLRAVSQHQVALLRDTIQALDLPPKRLEVPEVPISRLGGFLALRCPDASHLSQKLRDAGVHTDARGTVLRLGPAPYLSDRQLRDAVGIFGQVVGR